MDKEKIFDIKVNYYGIKNISEIIKENVPLNKCNYGIINNFDMKVNH